MNWLEGFRRLKVLLQVAVFLGLSFFAYGHWKDEPYFTKKLGYEESFSSDADKKADEAYKKSLEKIGLKPQQRNPTNLKISTVYRGFLEKYEFPLNTSDAEITKALRKTKGTEFGQVFWSWLGSCLISVIVIEVSFRAVFWIFQGFAKPR